MFIKCCFSLIYKVQTFAHFNWSQEEYKSKRGHPENGAPSGLSVIAYLNVFATHCRFTVVIATVDKVSERAAPVAVEVIPCAVATELHGALRCYRCYNAEATLCIIPSEHCTVIPSSCCGIANHIDEVNLREGVSEVDNVNINTVETCCSRHVALTVDANLAIAVPLPVVSPVVSIRLELELAVEINKTGICAVTIACQRMILRPTTFIAYYVPSPLLASG